MAVKSINELEIYREAMRIGEEVWNEVSLWDQFSKIAVGSQLVRAVDSIAANLSEGHGRYHYKENQNFCYYSRGSLTETQTFIEKAVNRKLIDTEKPRARSTAISTHSTNVSMLTSSP